MPEVKCTGTTREIGVNRRYSSKGRNEMEIAKKRRIHITSYSPIGGRGGEKRIPGNRVGTHGKWERGELEEAFVQN